MKKVRITLKDGAPGKKLWLFPSAEALYVWSSAAERGEQVQVPGITELGLSPGGLIEAELLGFDYAYEDKGVGRYTRFDYVRLALTTKPMNAAGTVATTHVGWSMGGLLPMRPYADDTIDVRAIDEDEATLDFDQLFREETHLLDE